MIDKVTDPKKIVTDLLVLKRLAEQGIDKDYVEFYQDYAPRRVNGKVVKGRSPYARFYKDRKSNKMVMEVSILPHCTADGQKIECGWLYAKNKYYSKANLFSAIVDGRQIKVICLSDQPHGAKKNDWVQWNPQLFLDGIEQTCGEATLLTTDPINAGYFENTLEWNHGICKRRIRIIEGRIRERWVFSQNPNGEVRIKHNHSGNYRLRLLTCKINDDEELIPASVFNEAEYPFEVMASPETFYPDPDPETSSVDGYCQHQDLAGLTWTEIVGAAGFGAYDSVAQLLLKFRADEIENRFDQLNRIIVLFDTSGLPDDVTVTGAVLSIYGWIKGDDLSATPDINVYKSTPFANTALQIDDFVDIGTVALCAVAITYVGWALEAYNDFTLTDVDTDGFGYIPVDGVAKFGLRNANYDVAEELDPGNHPPPWVSTKDSWLYAYSADEGNTTKDPKLVVTYTPTPPAVTKRYIPHCGPRIKRIQFFPTLKMGD